MKKNITEPSNATNTTRNGVGGVNTTNKQNVWLSETEFITHSFAFLIKATDNIAQSPATGLGFTDGLDSSKQTTSEKLNVCSKLKKCTDYECCKQQKPSVKFCGELNLQFRTQASEHRLFLSAYAQTLARVFVEFNQPLVQDSSPQLRKTTK